MGLCQLTLHAAVGMNLVKQLAGQQVPGSSSSGQQGASVQARPVGAAPVQALGRALNVDGIGASSGFVPVTANADPNNPNTLAKSGSTRIASTVDQSPAAPRYKFEGIAADAQEAPNPKPLAKDAPRGLLVKEVAEPVATAGDRDQIDEQYDTAALAVAESSSPKAAKSGVEHKAKAAKNKAKAKKAKRAGTHSAAKASTRNQTPRQIVEGADYRDKLLAQSKAAARNRFVAKRAVKKPAVRGGKKLPHITKRKVKATKSLADTLRKQRIERKKKALKFVPDEHFGKHEDKESAPAAATKPGGKFAFLKEQLDAGKQYEGK